MYTTFAPIVPPLNGKSQFCVIEPSRTGKRGGGFGMKIKIELGCYYCSTDMAGPGASWISHLETNFRYFLAFKVVENGQKCPKVAILATLWSFLMASHLKSQSPLDPGLKHALISPLDFIKLCHLCVERCANEWKRAILSY